MITYTRGKIEHLLKIEFVRFCVVGGTGFVINFAILTALNKGLQVPLFAAQLIGAEIALFSNFMLHHHWTYKSHKVEKALAALVLQFHATSWPAIIGSALMVTAGEKFLHLNNFMALTVSSAIALLWNFMWSKYVVWRDVNPKQLEEIIE